MQSLKCQALEMELANAESPNALPFLLGYAYFRLPGQGEDLACADSDLF